MVRLREQVVKHSREVPNYTCVETVQRRQYEPVAGRAAKSCDAILSKAGRPDFMSGMKLATADGLRLDVALAPDREIYSWAGASRFEDREIDEIVPEGAMGTGAFAAHLLNIFGAHNQKFFYEGQTSVDGREALQYSLVVPLAESTYRVKAHGQWLLTGYTATLFMDPKNAEVVSLHLRTDELPAATELCETDTSLQYELVRLGANEYLLPKVALQRFIGRDGANDENSITFSACREYQAQSKLNFGIHPAAGAREGAPATGLELPAGLPVTVELTTAVRSEQAAAGDRIEGRLAKAIRDEKQQKTLVPEGAVVHGRLMRVETRHAPSLQVTVVFRWETVEVGGVSVPLSLTPNRRTADLNLPTHGVLRQRGVVLELPAPGEGRYAILRFPGDQATVRAGDRSEWLAAKPE